MTGSIIRPFEQTQLSDAWISSDNRPINSNPQPSTISVLETVISDSTVYNPIIPPPPETQPTDAWIDDEDQPKMESSKKTLHFSRKFLSFIKQLGLRIF